MTKTIPIKIDGRESPLPGVFFTRRIGGLRMSNITRRALVGATAAVAASTAFPAAANAIVAGVAGRSAADVLRACTATEATGWPRRGRAGVGSRATAPSSPSPMSAAGLSTKPLQQEEVPFTEPLRGLFSAFVSDA